MGPLSNASTNCCLESTGASPRSRPSAIESSNACDWERIRPAGSTMPTGGGLVESVLIVRDQRRVSCSRPLETVRMTTSGRKLLTLRTGSSPRWMTPPRGSSLTAQSRSPKTWPGIYGSRTFRTSTSNWQTSNKPSLGLLAPVDLHRAVMAQRKP